MNINSFVLFRGSIIESWMFQFLSDPGPIIVYLWHCWNQVEAKVFPKCYTDFSKLTHGFVKIVVWICQDCHMYFLPFAKPKQAEVWRFLQAVTWIDQNCYMYLVLSAKPNQAEVWLRFLNHHCNEGMFVWGERREVAWFFKLFICIKQFTPGSVVPLALFLFCDIVILS